MEKDLFEIDNKQDLADVEEILDNLTLFDDDLMSRVFDKNIPATQLFLRIVLERDDINVISVVGQEEMKNAEVGKRNITLDVHAVDNSGQEIDIEVQGNSSGAHVKRARFHSAMVDSRLLGEGQDFKNMKDSYVIFMYKHDKFNKGLPIYHIDRYVRETNELLEDGSHIIYVNGKYKGDDPIGQLVSDFHQKDADNMHYKELADGVRHFKETEGGREDMCEAVEKYGERKADRRQLIDIINLMESLSLSAEQAMNALKIPESERAIFAEKINQMH